MEIFNKIPLIVWFFIIIVAGGYFLNGVAGASIAIGYCLLFTGGIFGIVMLINLYNYYTENKK